MNEKERLRFEELKARAGIIAARLELVSLREQLLDQVGKLPHLSKTCGHCSHLTVI